MLGCCNRHFFGGYYRVLSNKDSFYRHVEFGICPICGTKKFLDFRIIKERKKMKKLSGQEAQSAYDKVLSALCNEKHGSFSNQNYHYGDFKKSRKKDSNGNIVYLQLRKNFNGETEVLGEIETSVYKI